MIAYRNIESEFVAKSIKNIMSAAPNKESPIFFLYLFSIIEPQLGQ